MLWVPSGETPPRNRGRGRAAASRPAHEVTLIGTRYLRARGHRWQHSTLGQKAQLPESSWPGRKPQTVGTAPEGGAGRPWLGQARGHHAERSRATQEVRDCWCPKVTLGPHSDHAVLTAGHGGACERACAREGWCARAACAAPPGRRSPGPCPLSQQEVTFHTQSEQTR